MDIEKRNIDKLTLNTLEELEGRLPVRRSLLATKRLGWNDEGVLAKTVNMSKLGESWSSKDMFPVRSLYKDNRGVYSVVQGPYEEEELYQGLDKDTAIRAYNKE